MAKTTQETAPSEQKISLTYDELKQLLNEAKAEQETASPNDLTSTLKPLIEAIIESRKPYVSEESKKNDEAFRKAAREAAQATKRNLKLIQDGCPHVKGLGGTEPGSSSSFWIHRLDTGETVGICSYCQKVISSLNPADQIFFRKAGNNSPSSAGQRQFFDPLKAQTARFSEEEKEEIYTRLNVAQ